jgi:hypothetical protein
MASTIDIGAKELLDFLKQHYEVPEHILAFEIKAGLDIATEITWHTYASKKDNENGPTT